MPKGIDFLADIFAAVLGRRSPDRSQDGTSSLLAAAEGQPGSTYKAMQAELDKIETLTRRILLVIALVILAYAATNAVRQDTCVLLALPPPQEQSCRNSEPAAAAQASSTKTICSARTHEAEPAVYVANYRPCPSFLLTISLYGSLVIGTMLCGGMVGFLFGIPRQTLKQTPPGFSATASSTAESHRGGFVGNTNLEEISDWLTKIMVGLGLTQAYNLYSGFAVAKNEFVSLSMANTPGADSMFSAIALSGFILGFLYLYMETRTRVTLLLAASRHVQDNNFTANDVLKVVSDHIDPERNIRTMTAKTLNPVSPDASPTEEDKRIAKLPVDVPADMNALITWINAQISTGNFPQAEKGLLKALDSAPDRPELYTALAAVRNWRGKPKAANDLLDRTAERFPGNPRVWKNKLLVSLYLEPPRSYTEALAAADALRASDASASEDPFVWLWIACAYGQKYSNVAGIEKDLARDAALEAVRQVIRKSQPGSLVRQQLRKIFDPTIENPDPLENDLEVFYTDAEFKAEIYPPI